MDLKNAVKILETLAAGCSPATGEIIPDESVLNQREVIRALQFAIDNLKKEALAPIAHNNSIVEIEEQDIQTAIQLFTDLGKPPTDDRLTDFFLASGAPKNNGLHSNTLYGKYRNQYTKGQLQDFFIAYLAKRGYLNKKTTASRENKNQAWDNIDFFEKPTFNNLSETDIDNLKEQINKLGITKTKNLSDFVKASRKKYPRAYEPWNEEEKQIMNETLKHTNDIEILTKCFQRGEGSIISFGKKIIFERTRS